MSTRRRAAALVLPLFLLAACGTDSDSDSDGSVSANGDGGGTAAGECAAIDGPTADINTTGDEPQLQIPQPEGWERNTQMDSEIVRLTLVQPELEIDGFAPNLVVTGEASPADPQESFDVQLDSIRDGLGVPEVSSTEGELCGHPAMTVEYTLPEMGSVPERPATVQMVVVAEDDRAFTYTFTAQSAPETDPAFEEDVRAMLEGVQISD